MIGGLTGKVESISGDTVLLDVGGVGYELSLTAAALERCVRSGERVKLVVYTDVRENAIALYGFDSGLEKQIFLLLRKVKGIGSKTALGIVSSLRAEDILSCIGRGDVSALRKVPGVGAKTAERLIVELREAVNEFTLPAGVAPAPRDSLPPRQTNTGVFPETHAAADVVLALERLGFAADRARQVVGTTIEKLREDGQKAPEQFQDAGELLRLALANIQ